MSHDELTRRRFLQASAALAGAAALSPLLTSSSSAAAPAPSPVASAPSMPAPAATQSSTLRTAVDQVALGATGLKLSRLGMGTGSENGRTQTALGKDEFIKLIHYAFDKGITFFDTCDRYETMPWMADALKGLPREKLFIQSKITGTPADVVAAIDAERKKLNTDYIDSMLIHSQTTANWSALDAWKRIMDGFNTAKDKKLIKAKGSSCHNLPALTDAAKNDFHDLHLVRVNPQGKYIDGPSGRGYTASETFPVDPVLAQIKDMKSKGRGIIGMKILGNGLFTAPEDREKSIRFAMANKNIDAVLMGFKSNKEIDEAIDRINKALVDAA
ncbi:MAG TPA: aldo/keto reductase [Phycisphaerae bacterium]|jgi:predicted aldo/keto reductase-like oxidoreductase